MSDNRRNATLKALIDAAITELLVKTSGEQIYLDDNTTLSSKMAEMVAAINLRDKKTDVDAKIKTVTDSLNSTSESLGNDISNLNTKVSTLENVKATKTELNEQISSISESLSNDINTLESNTNAKLETKADKTALGNLAAKDKVAKDDLDTALQTELDAKATTTDVDTKISTLQSSSDTKFSDTDKAINLRPTQTEVTEQIAALKQEIMGDLPVEAYNTFTEMAAYIEEHQEAADALTAAVGNKADKSVVDDILTVINGLGALAKKDKVAKDDLDASLQTELDAKATTTYVDEQVGTINTSLSGKSDSNHTHDDRYYTESEIDTKLDTKSNTGHTHDDRYYTETEIDTKLNTKSNTSHTHDDRYYTESEIDTKLDTKSNTDHTHDLNAMINTLDATTTAPTDNDYFVSQYVGGGTTHTTYHRRPISTLWSYIKGKADKVYAALSHKHTKADITDFPTSMPASDVPAWAKAATKPTYTKSDVGLGNVGNFKAVSTVANQGLTDTEKANARSNIGAGASSFSGDYNDLANRPTVDSTLSASSTNAVQNKVVKSALDGKSDSSHTHGAASTSVNGFMTTTMVTKLNGIAEGANKTTVDSALSATSTNPVQNKAIKSALDGKAASSHTHDDRYYTETEIDKKLANVSAGVPISQAEYNALSEAEKNSETTYYIYDADTTPNASTIPFESSNYTAKNVGAALNEIKSYVGEGYKLQPITQAAYDALTTIDPKTFYFITD